MDGKRISAERERLKLTQAELAEKLNVSQKSISKYERSNRRPTYETLIKMSELFGVSIDYLIGNSEDRGNQEQNKSDCTSPHDELTKKNKHDSVKHGFFFFFFDDKELKNNFVYKLNQEMKDKEITLQNFSEQTSIPIEKCSAYINGDCEPRLEDLVSISQALEVSVDYLLGQVPKTSYYENKILRPFIKLNIDNKDIIIGKAKELLKEQEREEAVAAASDDYLEATGTK